MKTYTAPAPKRPPRLSAAAVKSRPRSYDEWKVLRQWNKLPPWEPIRPGYLLRLAREDASLTQQELARRLGCSQQAVAQAERWNSNPTVDFMRRWSAECGRSLQIRIE